MKILQSISLWLVGLFFILSGFLKAVDPSGGASQIADYMTAFHIEFLISLSPFLAVFLAALEFILGMHLVIRFRINWVAWPTLLMMVFFTFLTLIILIFNPVSDCGCFGEAFKLTHWETFIKNLVLLPLAFVIFKYRYELTSPIDGIRGLILSGFQVLFVLLISFIAFIDAPIFDFRPFKVGVNIPTAMSLPPGAILPEYDTRFILEKDGVQKEFGVSDYPYTDSTWIFVSSNTITLKEGDKPLISDFNLRTKEGGEANALIFEPKQAQFVIFSARLSDMDTENIDKLIKLNYWAKDKGYGFYCVTNSTNNEIDTFDQSYSPGFTYLTADYRVIRTVTRANPTLMILQEGTIVGKWNFNSIDDTKVFDNPLAGAITLNQKRTNNLMIFGCIMLLIAGTSIFYRYKS